MDIRGMDGTMDMFQDWENEDMDSCQSIENHQGLEDEERYARETIENDQEPFSQRGGRRDVSRGRQGRAYRDWDNPAAPRTHRRDSELDTTFADRQRIEPRRRRSRHQGRIPHLRRGDYYRPDYNHPDNQSRDRSPRARVHHYTPSPPPYRRPSPDYVQSAETELVQAMADMEVKIEDREDRRDRGGGGGGRGRSNNGNNRKRRYDGKLRTCTIHCLY